MNRRTSAIPSSDDLVFFIVKEVADILQISRSTVYNLIKAGELRAVQIGRAVRVRRSDLEEYIWKNPVIRENNNEGDKEEISLCWPAPIDLDQTNYEEKLF